MKKLILGIALFLTGCTKYSVKVGECFMPVYEQDVTIKIVEKREFGATVEMYVSGKLTRENVYVLYGRFDELIRRDCHR